MHIELILPYIMFATFVYFRKTHIIFDRVDDNCLFLVTLMV